MYGNQMNDNVIVSFARALANNNNLKEFVMLGGYGFRQRVPFNGYAAFTFTCVLGNSSSFSTRTVLTTLL
jgi:hypothetical protein